MSNDRVRQWAVDHLGQQVGDGECFALVDQALRNSGDKSAADFGQVGPNVDYVWGTATTLASLRPGDLIQFRNYRVRVVTVTVRRTTLPDGGWDESTQTQERTDTRPHHSAVVDAVGSGGEVTVLEQNVGGVRRVRRNTLTFSGSTNTTTTTAGNVTTTVTRTVTVSGTLRYYRPVAR